MKKNRNCIIPLAFDASIGGFPSEYRHPVWYGKTRMVGLSDGKKIEDIYNGLDTIPACDRQTDGRTSCYGIIRAMHTRRALKTIKFTTFIKFLSRPPFDSFSLLQLDGYRHAPSSRLNRS